LAEESKEQNGENFDSSFIMALKHKIGDIMESQSNMSEITHKSLMKNLKQKSGQVHGMSEFIRNTTNL
jgi:hypothetical protein